MRKLPGTKASNGRLGGSPQKILRNGVLPLALLTGAQGLVPRAMAQSAMLEEVVVTARKKAESLQDEPISIQTVNMEMLQDNHITNLEELSFYMPNVTVGKSGSDDNLFIRGIGSGVNLGFKRRYNLRLAVAEVNGAWEIAVIGKNLTDETTTSWINDVSNNYAPAPLPPAFSETYFARTDRPRTIAVQGIYRF